MSNIKRIDLTTQFVTESNASDKPPLPSRPSSGKFHTRGSGKLFPTTYNNKFLTGEISPHQTSVQLQNKNGSSHGSDDSLALVIHPDFKLEPDNNSINSPKNAPNYSRRTQSAKARSRPKSDAASKPPAHRPFSANNKQRKCDSGVETTETKPVAVLDLGHKVIPDLFKIERDKILALPDPRDYNHNAFQDMPPMHYANTRPSSAKHSQTNKDPCICKTEKESKEQKHLKPSIYGLQRQRHFFGSTPDLSNGNDNGQHFPYKTDKADIVEKKDREQVTKREIPSTLDPLMPWLQTDAPAEVIGVSPHNCLVFLAPVDWSELPEVPESIEADDDLAFIKDVTTPKPWNPKKYPHYSSKPVEEWVCKHGSTPGPGDMPDSLYRPAFRVPRMRCAEVIRKEITDLENLLKGVGTADSDCNMVKFQSEIHHFNDMMTTTMGLVPDRLKNPPEPPDTFGLNKMCADHDSIIERIAERVQECRAELADIELEAGIETARRHFTRPNSAI